MSKTEISTRTLAIEQLMRVVAWISEHEPTHEDLEAASGLSRATVTRLIGRARRLGVQIEWVRAPIKGQGGSSGHYRVGSWGVFSRPALLRWANGRKACIKSRR